MNENLGELVFSFPKRLYLFYKDSHNNYNRYENKKQHKGDIFSVINRWNFSVSFHGIGF